MKLICGGEPRCPGSEWTSITWRSQGEGQRGRRASEHHLTAGWGTPYSGNHSRVSPAPSCAAVSRTIHTRPEWNLTRIYTIAVPTIIAVPPGPRGLSPTLPPAPPWAGDVICGEKVVKQHHVRNGRALVTALGRTGTEWPRQYIYTQHSYLQFLSFMLVSVIGVL